MLKKTLLMISWMWLSAVTSVGAENLTLKQCLQLVRQQNPTLQTEARNLELASERIRETRGHYLPEVSMDAGYTLQADPQQVLIGGNTEPTQDQNYSYLSLSAEQLLYDFGRTAARVSGAEALARGATSDLNAREQELFLKTTRAYVQVLTAQLLVKLAEEEIARIEAHRSVVEVLYDTGVVTRNDLLQAAVWLAASRQERLARQGELENAWLALNYLTGRPAEARTTLEPTDMTWPTSDSESNRFAERPELLAQSERMVAAEASVVETRHPMRPKLFARLGADYLENSHAKEQTIYRATLGLQLNLFDGQAMASRQQQALITLNRERQRFADLQAMADLDYRQASNDARVARQRLEVAKTAILQAEENLRINQDRYREQVGTATEVLDAQTLLSQSRTALVLAQFDEQVAVARILRATGQL
jgi:outer membrane protein